MSATSHPSPVGQEFCNKMMAYKPKVIHSLSTTRRFSVDKPEKFIHRLVQLSTKTVDNSIKLWITFRSDVKFLGLYSYTTIQAVDKPVDKRGKPCG